MQLTYVPEICSGDERAYEGEVTLRMPDYDERLELLEAVDGLEKWTAQLRALVKLLPKYLASLKIRRIADGHEFVSLEEMTFETELGPVISEACHKLVGKYQVGNGSKPT